MTTASVMGPHGHASCNILAISDPLHLWEGVDCPSPPQELLLHGHNNTSDHQGWLSKPINPQAIGSIWRVIC